MKLCWLLHSDRSGGISPVVLSCCRQAHQDGHEATMLMLSPPIWITSQNFRVSSLGLSALAPETPKVLLQWLEENPQDVLFFNGCDEFDPIISHLPSTVKCVYVVHDTASSYWTKALAQEDNLEAIIAVSETVARKFRHRLKQPQKLSVIHNGCVFPELSQFKVACKDDLIFLGGENPLKGAFDVLKLWKYLVQQGFTGKLHWFGQLTPKFREMISQLPQSERVNIYGYVHRDLIYSTAASAKVLLMLSRVEPFGMSTIEAMSMGCVPVAWDIDTGTKEIITANRTGLLAPLGNIPSLAQQVWYACKNYPVLSTAVIERARSGFEEAVMWKGYVSLINRLSQLKLIERSHQGQKPSAYYPPRRYFQLLPLRLRLIVREIIGQTPSLSYWLRDVRGF